MSYIKYETHVIKQYLLKWISYNQANSTAYHMMKLQKVPKVNIACFYSGEGDLYWLENSPLNDLLESSVEYSSNQWDDPHLKKNKQYLPSELFKSCVRYFCTKW